MSVIELENDVVNDSESDDLLAPSEDDSSLGDPAFEATVWKDMGVLADSDGSKIHAFGGASYPSHWILALIQRRQLGRASSHFYQCDQYLDLLMCTGQHTTFLRLHVRHPVLTFGCKILLRASAPVFVGFKFSERSTFQVMSSGSHMYIVLNENYANSLADRALGRERSEGAKKATV